MRVLFLMLAICITGGAFIVWSVLPALRAQFGSSAANSAPVASHSSPRSTPMIPTAVPHEDAIPPAVETAQISEPADVPAVRATVAAGAPPPPVASAPAPAVRWAAASNAEPDWSAALARQSQHVSNNPEDFDARFELAAIQMRLKLWTSAIAELDRIAQAHPDDVRVQFNRAQALRAAGRIGDARREWDRAVELDPASIAARAYRGETLLELGLWAEAEADFRAVLHDQPEDDVAALNLALALHRSGRTPDALATIETLLTAHPRHLAALKRAAELAAELAAAPDAPPAASNAAVAYANSALAIDARDEAMTLIVKRWSQR